MCLVQTSVHPAHLCSNANPVQVASSKNKTLKWSMLKADAYQSVLRRPISQRKTKFASQRPAIKSALLKDVRSVVLIATPIALNARMASQNMKVAVSKHAQQVFSSRSKS